MAKGGKGRPPMKQEDHPAHNVPPPTEQYDGHEMAATPMGQDSQMINQIMANYGAPMKKGDRDFDNDDY